MDLVFPEKENRRRRNREPIRKGELRKER